MLSKIKLLQDKMDLSKRLPGYINKKIFQTAVLLMFMLVFVDMSLNGWSPFSYSVSCNPNNNQPCINPLHDCAGVSLFDANRRCTTYDYNSAYYKTVCRDGLCGKEFLLPGEKYGRQDLLYQNGPLGIFLLIALAFAVNHLVYYYKTGNWKVKVKND